MREKLIQILDEYPRELKDDLDHILENLRCDKCNHAEHEHCAYMLAPNFFCALWEPRL